MKREPPLFPVLRSPFPRLAMAASLRWSVLAVAVTCLTACSGSQTLAGRFAPAPELKQKVGGTGTPPGPETPQTSTDNFPSDIPRYPGAELLSAEPGATPGQGRTRWSSGDPANAIASFYQQQFESNNWEILQPFSPDASQPNSTLRARRDGLEVTVSLLPAATTTEFLVEYRQDRYAGPPPNFPAAPSTTGNPVAFSDLDRLADPFRQYVQDLASLGVLSPAQGNQFQPDAPLTRREYARWLVAANNQLHASLPGKQIRLANPSSQPAFKDIPPSDPDFGAIQGLAEAGLIPSPLRGEASASLFRPQAPLTRETAIAWKVPLDTRKALPSASLDGIKETWGFQDAVKIDPNHLPSLYADYQNGDRANIRRILGYTALFQPKKPVTRAEGAAALWYFGFQGDGLSATDALQIQSQPSPSPNS